MLVCEFSLSKLTDSGVAEREIVVVVLEIMADDDDDDDDDVNVGSTKPVVVVDDAPFRSCRTTSSRRQRLLPLAR